MKSLRSLKRGLHPGPGGKAILAGAAISLMIVLFCLYALRPARYPVTPNAEAMFTSTRYVTCLLAAPDGELWAGTMGGILRRGRDGTTQKYTLQDGLPSNEVRSLKMEGGDFIAACPNGSARRRADRWESIASRQPSEANGTEVLCAAVRQGETYTATPEGLYRQTGKDRREIPLPPSTGTHVSALLPYGDVLLAAMFGDGVWSFDGVKWSPMKLNLPLSARDITAMAVSGGVLWLGTRRAGLWECGGKKPIQHLYRDEPVDHNCQALLMFHGNLFISTLEEGLAMRTPRGWGHINCPIISSNAPRQMVEFRDALYLRHGNGKVDRWDGTRWERNVCAALPRNQASALAADSQRLYVAQWGGWSEFDGHEWTHHLDLPVLQGLPITSLWPEKDHLWIGTQNHGIADFDRQTSRLVWHDERSGLRDDWITTLLREDGRLFAGTFVAGLALKEGEHWNMQPELKTENVTALTSDGRYNLIIATRSGVWNRQLEGTLIRLKTITPHLDNEAQCLCYVPGGVWIGTRTGLCFCPI